MNLRGFTRMAIALLILVTPRLVVAQAESTIGSNIPDLAKGTVAPVTPGEAQAPANVFQGGITVNGNYDDDVFPGGTSREWDVLYGVAPRISFEETRSRIVWSLDYMPGVDVSQRGLVQDYFSQRFGGTVTWQVSPHGVLSAEQYYDVTVNPFDTGNQTAAGPTVLPNETIYVPYVRQKMLLSHALYSYQSSAQTTMGVGGTFDLQKYDSTPQSGPTTSLINSQIASGDAYIAHQISARNQLGVEYSLQDMRFPQDGARTTTHSFLVFDQTTLSDHSRLTLYAGPEYSLTFDQVVLNLGFVVVTIPVNAKDWNVAGGLTYSWTGERLAAGVDITRGVSTGGGVVGAVNLTSGAAHVSWLLTRHWTLTGGIAGASDQLLAATSSNQLLTYSGTVGLTRQFFRGLSLTWDYQRLNQTGSITGFTLGNRDIFSASLTYTFLRPVGR
jgi:hypothetical protein